MTAEPLQKKQQTSIDYGHNGSMVVMIFNNRIENLMLTEQQADEMVAGIQKAKLALVTHRAAAAQQGGPGNA